MKKFLASILFVFGLFVAAPVRAVCPICTIAVGAGVGLSRWLGIDDTIAGLWVGGLLISVSLWTVNWMIKKNYNFKYRTAIVFVGYYAITLIPLYYGDIIGHPYNKFLGIDKLIFGAAVGTLLFFIGERAYRFVKEKNGGHAHFPFEKIVFPVAPLVVSSLILYFITK